LNWVTFLIRCRIHQVPKKKNLKVRVKVGFGLFDEN
jgi:hypothetical protein